MSSETVFWNTVKSLIFCSYCRRQNGQEDEEKTSLLKNEKNPPFSRPYEKLVSEINCKECPHSPGMENAKFTPPQSAAVPADSGESKPDKPVNVILPVSQQKSLSADSRTVQTISNSSKINAPIRMESDGNFSKPTHTQTSVKATQSVSAAANNVVSANSPLWQQVESINPVSDSRPPTMK